jgi:hypothetical protein
MFAVFSVSATFWTSRIRNSGLRIRNKKLQIRNFVMMLLSCWSGKKNILIPFQEEYMLLVPDLDRDDVGSLLEV